MMAKDIINEFYGSINIYKHKDGTYSLWVGNLEIKYLETLDDCFEKAARVLKETFKWD